MATMADRVAFGMRGMTDPDAPAITDAPASAVCGPCKARGHICFAQKMVEGEAWCVMCLDGQPCVWQQKQKVHTRPQMKNAVHTAVEAKKEATMETQTETSKPATVKPPKSNGHAARGSTDSISETRVSNRTRPGKPTKTCSFPGCGAELGSGNQSGRCRRHFKIGKKSQSHPANGAAHKNGSAHKNGAASNGNGAALKLDPGEVRADRLDQLFLSLPITAKARLADAWLTGKI